jgi:hypothetical protein
MGAASLSVFAYLLGPIGLLVVLVLPGTLVAVALGYLHGHSLVRRLAVVVYSSIANFCFFPFFAWGPVKLVIYAGVASLGLAALCIESHRGRELSAAHAGASFLVGVASSLPILLSRLDSELNLLFLGVLGLFLVWPQYFLHSRYLVAETVE